MIARRTFPRALQGEAEFRWRGGDVSRLEALSDMVFAFAFTLIVVSLEVPRSFDELRIAFRQLPVFAACFTVLLMCWHYNYRYHRRYGFEDFVTEVLNAVLLFLILMYVYPLKFLFGLLWDMFLGVDLVVRGADGLPVLGGDGAAIPILERGQMKPLMVLYSGGYAAIFALYALMYYRALRRRDALELNPVEEQITRATIGSFLLHVGFGAASILLVLAHPSLSPYSGLIYVLMGPAQGVFWAWQGRKIGRIPRTSA